LDSIVRAAGCAGAARVASGICSAASVFAGCNVVVATHRVARNRLIAAARDEISGVATDGDAGVGLSFKRPIDIAEGERQIVAHAIRARFRVLLRASRE
jgi:hypothetical protein